MTSKQVCSSLEKKPSIWEVCKNEPPERTDIESTRKSNIEISCFIVCFFFFFCCFYANLLKFLRFCSIKDTLKIYFCHCGDTFLTLLKKKG